MEDRQTETQKVLDRSAIDRLVTTCGDGGAEVVACLLETFFADVPLLLASLERALSEGDEQEIRRVAHTLKSHGATFGAPFLGHLAFELEEMGKTGRLEGAGDLAGELVCECGRVRRELRMAQAELCGQPCPALA